LSCPPVDQTGYRIADCDSMQTLLENAIIVKNNLLKGMENA